MKFAFDVFQSNKIELKMKQKSVKKINNKMVFLHFIVASLCWYCQNVKQKKSLFFVFRLFHRRRFCFFFFTSLDVVVVVLFLVLSVYCFSQLLFSSNVNCNVCRSFGMVNGCVRETKTMFLFVNNENADVLCKAFTICHLNTRITQINDLSQVL